jgi:CRP-like cAMP-binding protein
LANVGRRIALERVSHLICECFTRMKALGLAGGSSFQLPLTQVEIGDATGLSNVHINRTMQSLRRAGLVKSEGKIHTIVDWARMTEAADFDPAYLHLLAPVAATKAAPQ